jgi:hypothetical protein
VPPRSGQYVTWPVYKSFMGSHVTRALPSRPGSRYVKAKAQPIPALPPRDDAASGQLWHTEVTQESRAEWWVMEQ